MYKPKNETNFGMGCVNGTSLSNNHWGATVEKLHIELYEMEINREHSKLLNGIYFLKLNAL